MRRFETGQVPRCHLSCARKGPGRILGMLGVPAGRRGQKPRNCKPAKQSCKRDDTTTTMSFWSIASNGNLAKPAEA